MKEYSFQNGVELPNISPAELYGILEFMKNYMSDLGHHSFCQMNYDELWFDILHDLDKYILT